MAHLEESVFDCLYHELPKRIVYSQAKERTGRVVALGLCAGAVSEARRLRVTELTAE